jgi:hypothetical protein
MNSVYVNKPNFFIVGAPKCGTTALSEYLREHENIFVSEPKEPYYFSDDFDYYFSPGNRSLEHYEGIYKNANSEVHKAIGEASVWYLYSRNAISNIMKYNPSAKIIIMIRNPVDLVYSLHSQLIYMLDEEEKDFYTAWNLQSQRANGECIPEKTRVVDFLLYGQVGKIGEQIERLYSLVPREQVLIIKFEDFISNTRSVYAKTLDFLNVNDDNRRDFPVINENKRHYLNVVASFTQRPPKVLVKGAQVIKGITNLERLGIRPFIRSLNMVKSHRVPLKSAFREQLQEYFYEDIRKLEQLAGLDLQKWLS